jgi:Secretion system C-terminal sorting domain
MIKSIFTLLILIVSINSFATDPFRVKNGKYSSFNGTLYDCKILEGKYTVLYIENSLIKNDQLTDTTTLQEIIRRTDAYYNFYKNFCGKEPLGGNAEFGNKSTVAFVNPSCGAACGLIGYKGIEVSPGMFIQVYNEIQIKGNTNRIGIIGYEFGRNFFTMGDKLLFPTRPNSNDKNGGFAEAFATVAGLLSDHDYLSNLPFPQNQFQETLLFEKKSEQYLNAYINDLNSNPYNSLAATYQNNDVNRNTWAFVGPSTSILLGMNKLFKSDSLFAGFFKHLGTRKKVETKEDVLDNLAYSFSFSTRLNLVPLFKNVFKFPISKEIESVINTLPTSKNRLIKDLDVLWFTTPIDSINFNVRSLNHNATDDIYQVLVDGKLFSESKNGNNFLTYDLLKNRDTCTIKVNLLNSSNEVLDSYSVLLTKRSRFSLGDLKSEFHFVDNQSYTKPEFSNGEFRIKNLSNYESFPLFEMTFPLKRNRKILIKGQIRNEVLNDKPKIDTNGNNIIDNWSKISISGGGGSDGTSRVGYDIGKDDITNYYSVNAVIPTSIFFNQPWAIPLVFIPQKIYLESNGVNNSYFKDIIVEDITDMDSDGITDFKDDCPIIQNPQAPVITEKNGIYSIDNASNIQWYFNSKIVSEATSNTFKPSQAGNYSVQITDVNGCKSPLSKQISFTKTDLVLSTLLEDDKLTTYPNPFSQTIKLKIDNLLIKEQMSIRITDTSGKVRFELFKIEDTMELDLKNLSPGIYFLSIFDDSNLLIKTIKLLKEK